MYQANKHVKRVTNCGISENGARNRYYWKPKKNHRESNAIHTSFIVVVMVKWWRQQLLLLKNCFRLVLFVHSPHFRCEIWANEICFKAFVAIAWKKIFQPYQHFSCSLNLSLHHNTIKHIMFAFVCLLHSVIMVIYLCDFFLLVLDYLDIFSDIIYKVWAFECFVCVCVCCAMYMYAHLHITHSTISML